MLIALLFSSSVFYFNFFYYFFIFISFFLSFVMPLFYGRYWEDLYMEGNENKMNVDFPFQFFLFLLLFFENKDAFILLFIFEELII